MDYLYNAHLIMHLSYWALRVSESSDIIFDLLDYIYNAHLEMHLAYCALQVSKSSVIIFDPTTFQDVLYVPRVGSFIVDDSIYCDMRHTSQILDFVHSGIYRAMTCYFQGEDMFF